MAANRLKRASRSIWELLLQPHLAPWLSGISLLAAAALTGCGDAHPDRLKTFPVTGQVLWEGRPLAGAIVALHPQDSPDLERVPARAETDADGRFRLGTYDSEDGAPAGAYRVTVLWYPLAKNGESYEPGPNVVPARYSDPDESQLTVRIAEGENQIPPLDLRR